MAKNSVTDYDTVAANNTDVGNIAIEGSANVANFDNALREIMSHIADGTTMKTHVGLANADNTSDANKPVSTATQTALDAKLSLSGGTMTGNIIATGINLGGSGASNLLDDYEEGTWTPTVTATGTFTTSDAIYTKIGRLVTVQLTIVFTGASGSAVVGGLPFVVNEAQGVGLGREDAVNGYGIYARASEGLSELALFYMGATANATPFQSANGTFRILFTYVTDS
jgi:hypothetical protein